MKENITFVLSEEQREKADKWAQSKGYSQCYCFTFSLTGIGFGCSALIPETGETLDITDYDNW